MKAAAGVMNLGVDVSPAGVDREQWASPHKIIADVEERVRP
jgi:hypothetical protein